MLYCPKCQQLEATTPQKHDDGTVTYLCKKCGGVIPLRRDLRPGEVVAGFKIEEELGRGAMGIVYQARQTNLDREVAIKILSDDSASDEVYVERFFREARAAASLSHPNVVQAYDAGVTDDGIYYFVMEKITGENLELVLNNVGPLNIPQALDVFISVANALSYAWIRNQLSHGDIKPENIIMRLNGKVKLADFGLARRAKDPELADEDIRATPAYAPPEIIRGDKDVPGFKSDMYSFGATAYHILIGHEPFVGSDPMKVCEMQLTEIQTPLCELNPNIPKRLSDLVDTLMEKDPADRPASWSDVADELKDIQSELNPAAVPGEDAGVESEEKTRKTILFCAVAAALILLAAVIVAVVFTQPSATDVPDDDDLSVSDNTPFIPENPVSGNETEPASVHNAAFYRARWRMIQEESGDSGLDLNEVEKFVADAGAKAPAEAVAALAELRTVAKQSRALALRNELLDQASAFDPDSAKKLDSGAIDALYQAALSKRDELRKLDSGLSEHVFLPEHKKVIDAYVKELSGLRSAASAGGRNPAVKQPAKTGTLVLAGKIDGRGTFIFSGNTIAYLHQQNDYPTGMKVNGKSWNDLKKPYLLDFVPDFSHAEIAELSGRGTVKLTSTSGKAELAINDHQASSAQYRIALSFDPSRQNTVKTKREGVENGKTETVKTANASMDSKLIGNYLHMLDCLPGAIRDEARSAEALRLVNELLSVKDFSDETPRRNCLGIRKFLVQNNAPMLPYLNDNEKVLRGMKLFPRSYPDSVLVELSGSSFRLKYKDEKANITQKLTWNQIRKEEGEDQIVVTLINSPQLAKLSEDFREYLYVRALFFGVDPEVLRNRFARSSGLSAAKMEELGRITGFFQKTQLEEEEEEED